MNIAEAKLILELYGVEASSYDFISGIPREDRFVVLYDADAKYHAFYCERGERIREEVFLSESDALKYAVFRLIYSKMLRFSQ